MPYASAEQPPSHIFLITLYKITQKRFSEFLLVERLNAQAISMEL